MSTKPTLLHVVLCDFGRCDKKILLAFVLLLKTWILLNWPSSSQNVSSLIGPFFLKGSQVTGVQATHWYQCGGCKELWKWRWGPVTFVCVTFGYTFMTLPGGPFYSAWRSWKKEMGGGPSDPLRITPSSTCRLGFLKILWGRIESVEMHLCGFLIIPPFFFLTWPSLHLYPFSPLILLLHSEPDPQHSHHGGANLPGCRRRCRHGCGEEQKESFPGASHPGAKPHIWGLRLLQHSQPHRTGLGGWDLHTDKLK